MDHTGHTTGGATTDTTMAMANVTDESLTAGSFCNGNGGMIMYMDGFRFGLQSGQTCLNLYFPSWTLDTRAKFIGALVGIFFLAIAVEGVSKGRQAFVRAARRKRNWHANAVRGFITFMHGFQAFVGYVLMLAVMTYSAEMLIVVVVGLAAGYSIFFQTEENYLTQTAHVTVNPCCNFMEEEAKEIPRPSSTQEQSSDGDGSSSPSPIIPEATDAERPFLR